MIRTATLHGRKYKIFFEDGKLDGLCDRFENTSRQIFIMAEPHTQNELITTIHELLHAENWAATEDVIERVSTEIGRVLWRRGYRRP